jgi:hypothetical protein
MQRVLIMTGLLLLIRGTSCAQAREMILTVSDGHASETLHFGLAPGATDSIDAGLSEIEIPPAPPPGVFDARFVGAAIGEGMARDLRRGDTATAGVRVHEISLQAGEGSAITIGWDLPSDVAVLVQDIPTGELVHVTMRGAGTYTIVHPELVPRLRLTVHYKPLRIRIKAFLDGPFNRTTSAMNTALRSAGILATRFGAGNVPVAAVDSVAIEIRNAAAAVSATVRRYTPAWILADGTIRDFRDTAATEVMFDSVTGGGYYVVFRHRNHLPIMSAGRIGLTTSSGAYDFTIAQSRAYGSNPMKGLGTGGGAPFGLYAGDGNANGVINAEDANTVWRVQNGNVCGYLAGDYDLSGTVNATDKVVYWRLNNGTVGQVP